MDKSTKAEIKEQLKEIAKQLEQLRRLEYDLEQELKCKGITDFEKYAKEHGIQC